MDLRLQDKVILVTDGAKGIGAAIVKASAAESAKVVQAVGNLGKLDARRSNDKVGLEHGNLSDHLGSLRRNLGHDYSMAHYALSKGPHTAGHLLVVGGNVHLHRGLT